MNLLSNKFYSILLFAQLMFVAKYLRIYRVRIRLKDGKTISWWRLRLLFIFIFDSRDLNSIHDNVEPTNFIISLLAEIFDWNINDQLWSSSPTLESNSHQYSSVDVEGIEDPAYSRKINVDEWDTEYWMHNAQHSTIRWGNYQRFKNNVDELGSQGDGLSFSTIAAARMYMKMNNKEIALCILLDLVCLQAGSRRCDFKR